MFQLYAQKNSLTCCRREPLTSGSVNVNQAQFEFSEDWSGLTKTVVFEAGSVSKPMILDGDGTCDIPWEVLITPGLRLQAGVYGKKDDELVLPTVWADLGKILPGVPTPEGDVPPTPELWQQELAKKGDRLGYTEDGDLGLYSGKNLLSSVPVSGGGGPSYGIGHGLKVENGDLTVVTTDNFTGDNTLPMTAAGVEIIVGNIEALLGTI